MIKYDFENCKECGAKLIFEEEYDTCTACNKHKQFMDGKMPNIGDIFLMKMRKTDE